MSTHTGTKPLLVSAMVLALSLGGMPDRVPAKVELLVTGVDEVDRKTADEILTAFRQADEAVHQQNLDAVMAMYAEGYNYHGLKKADIRRIWADLFDQYQQISSMHLFSKMAEVGDGALLAIEVTCTGRLWAISETSGLSVPIDSWYEEIHYVIKENGAWRIRGNAGESPKALQFGTAPHPLF